VTARPPVRSTSIDDERSRRDLAETEAGKAALKIHAAETEERIAQRIKNPDALQHALRQKLEGQRDFAAEYRAKFPDGVNVAYRGSASTGQPPKGEDWCLAFGFAGRTVRRWLALLDADEFARKDGEILKRVWQLVEMGQAANFSSESIEWYTPRKYLDAVHEMLGGVDLDPASSPQANETVRATEIFTKADNGLEQTWHGRVFLNPPYGKAEDGHGSLAADFCNKAIAEYEAGNIESCIILVNSLHSQSWQAPLYDHAFCLVEHRIHFISADGEENENPTFQNIFVYLGHDALKFAKVFSRFGYVAKKIADESPQAQAAEAMETGR
jgi:hypothetical protein